MAWHVMIECSCDHCGRNEEQPHPTKDAQWRHLFKQGWRIRKGQHLCFECVYQTTGKWFAYWERSEDDAFQCCRYHFPSPTDEATE
jgi:hypothetical protein